MVIDQKYPAPIDGVANDQKHDLAPSGADLTRTPDAAAFPERQPDAELERAAALITEPELAQVSEPVAAPEVESVAEAEPTPVSDVVSVEQLTTVDRYYLVWTEYIQLHGHEPRDAALSQHLARTA
ncbi:hypothetical protein OG279_37320 (plasmid) [Streptomyces sp. NBC_01201]|uniref:hypothetical protein n=1 Tax=Streptomyces sp. NBC_01201 TaxID=2903770 RepID=UPI002E126AE1|nr:hypothetical protein OG279_37320 [Streptomyces sp. NBC_01201]